MLQPQPHLAQTQGQGQTGQEGDHQRRSQEGEVGEEGGHLFHLLGQAELGWQLDSDILVGDEALVSPGENVAVIAGGVR